jgi:hypothetical protein
MTDFINVGVVTSVHTTSTGVNPLARLALLQTTVHADIVCTVTGGDCPPTRYFPPFALSRTGTRFTYGAGVQVKVFAFGVRVEYQHISATGGDPDLLSLGIT